MHNGLEVTPSNPLGLVHFGCVPSEHGDPCEYDVATIPSPVDPAWLSAPDPDIINFSVFPSRVCSAPDGQTCLVYGDFTYFQTFVDIPLDVVVTQFTIAFSGMDDGSRVTIFNSNYPAGFVVPGSYVFLGGSGTTDLSSLVRSGEVNRVVVTQVDDCCVQNNLRSAVVVLNGVVVHTGCTSNAGCDDANACTGDVCNPDGSCSHTLVSCDDANACTADSCDPVNGCLHTLVSCDDANACTADACDAVSGCVHTLVNCDDANACTADSCDAVAGCVHTLVSCDDGNACTADSCDPVAGCVHTLVNCDDANACTADSCDPVAGCVHTLVSCDDGNACTTDSCSPTAGCVHTLVSCNDGNACTTDACNPATGCVHGTVSCDDGNACTLDTCDAHGGCAHINQCPDCSSAAATLASIWPPNHKMVTVGVKGVTDPQGQSTTISIHGVGQDEPTNDVGDGNSCPDAGPLGGSSVEVRAERSGTGNGRVYHLFFTATDPDGFSCSGEVTTCVPHDQGHGAMCVDDGASYDSLTCQ
jgi:hypothetical protein